MRMIRVALLTLAALFVGLCTRPAAAQQTFYDTEGRVEAPDLFETDGFRPVWQQQLEEQRKAAAAAAEAAKQSGATAGVTATETATTPAGKPRQ